MKNLRINNLILVNDEGHITLTDEGQPDRRDCLTRKNRAGETEYFHRSVVCMTVGKAPHVILGQEMLKPRDGAEKDEGELTGGKTPDRNG